MPEDKIGKPSIKPKPATFCVKRNVTHYGMFSSASGCENATVQTPQPMPRKSKHKANTDSSTSDHAFVSGLQQTKPPEDMDAIVTIPVSKSTISFDDENANAATSDTRSYSTISRTIEKKVFFKNYSCDAGTKEDDIALTHNAPTMAKVCWKSEEFLAVEPIAAIEEMELRSESLASLDDIPCSQQLARIEPSPERFLDDILRKKKAVKIVSAKGSNIKDVEEIEAAFLSDPTRLSNIIPSVNECISHDDNGGDDDYENEKSSKRKSVEYVNLMDSKQPSITENLPFYANMGPLDEETRESMTAEDKEQIRKMNWFFGVKKDTKTDLEMEVFNSIVSGNALTTGIRTKVVRQQQLQKGRRRLSHLKSNVKDSPTSHASGQLLQDLNRVKKWAIDKVPVLNKMRNKSTDDLLAVSRSNQSLSSWGHPTSTRSSDWSAWKQKFIKVMKKHFTGYEEEEERSTVVVATFGVPLEMCPMSSNNKHVPAIVEFCITVVEHLGLTSQGIYRIPGNNSSVNALLSELNKDPDSITFEHDRWQDVNVIGSLLKLFFRKLPEPLIITEIYDEIIQTAKCMNREKKLIKLKLHLLDLPVTNRETFKYLANHLKRVAVNQAENKMDAHNLAIMFGPSLVHPRTESTNQMLSDMKYQTDVVENIIKYCDWMFSDWTDDSNVPPDEGDQGYNIQCSASNPELLANAEAILAFKPSEPEPKSPEGSFSFFRNGLIRLSGRGKIRRKSGRSEAQVGIIPNSEREVRLKTVNLDNITRLVGAWKSHTQEPVPLKQELKRNLTQRYASRELEISAPLKTPPPQNYEEVDESKNEESIFSSIKRYPAYSFKNTTITGSGRKVRSKNHKPFERESHDSKPFLSESIETIEGNHAKASEISQCSWNFQGNYAHSGGSETSEAFAQVGEWEGRKESFVVRKPEGRSYFASANTGRKLFPIRSCSSRMKLTRLEVMQEVESFSPCKTDPSCMGRRMSLQHRRGEGWNDGDVPLFTLASPCHQ